MLKFLSSTGAVALAACFALAAPVSAAQFPQGGGMGGGMHMGGMGGSMRMGGMGGPMHMGGMGAPMRMGGMGAPMRMGGMGAPMRMGGMRMGGMRAAPAFAPRTGGMMHPGARWAGGWGHFNHFDHFHDHHHFHNGCGWDCDFFFPAAGFVAGAVVGSAFGDGYYDGYYPYGYYYPYYRTASYGDAHAQWCYHRYRSYRASDNTFQPYNGPRQQCISPDGY